MRKKLIIDISIISHTTVVRPFVVAKFHSEKIWESRIFDYRAKT